MRDDARTLGGTVGTVIKAGICCSPAIAINLENGASAGNSPALIVGAVACVLGAAWFGLSLEGEGSRLVKLRNSTILAVLLTVNFANAVGLSASHSDHGRNDALTQQSARQSLADDARTLSGTVGRLSAELGTASSASLRGDIAAREFDALYTRSKRCADATVTESRTLCAGLERSKAMLSAAVERDRLAGELAALNVQLRAAPVREGVDPKSEAIAKAFAFVGLAVYPRDVAYALVLLYALGIELLAAFGGMIRLPGAREAAAVAPQASVAVAVPDAIPAAIPPASAPRPSALVVFVAGLVKSDTATPFKTLYGMYSSACRAAGEQPETALAVGLAMSKQFKKNKGGDRAYFAKPRLAAVAA